MMFTLFQTTLLTLISLSLPVLARFTRDTTNSLVGSVTQNEAGTWCFQPLPISQSVVTCRSNPDDNMYEVIMAQHLLNSTSSINYYTANGTNMGIDYDASTFTTDYICMTGPVGDGSFVSICGEVFRNNDITSPPLCDRRPVPQVRNDDGCYTAPEGPPPTVYPTVTVSRTPIFDFGSVTSGQPTSTSDSPDGAETAGSGNAPPAGRTGGATYTNVLQVWGALPVFSALLSSYTHALVIISTNSHIL
ncbi:hypothetical protein FA15DRAFT_670955 [Coprinopsis marcescibilis]|uniref:Uncharacterized protein n=1 Tax=Coprinopsis marcescibilis TaxID=230819 RepID=A0A5C3KRI8_COPMA|nr:hypothetical protein FA15DRAFT_670955 [Coprinopsis marcescibilis]